MSEYFRLRFRKGRKSLYAKRETAPGTKSRIIWTLTRSQDDAYDFRKPDVIPRLLNGVSIFRQAMMSGFSWEIVSFSERVVEYGMEIFHLSGESIRVRLRR